MKPFRSRRSQRGAVAVLVAIAMGALIMAAGLALDMGHVFLNKTRLQNTVDAAALAAAKSLDENGNTDLARQEALQAFASNAAATGNAELATAYDSGEGGEGDIQVTVEFSETLPPFDTGALNGPYVRVRATGFVLPPWLARVGGILEKRVAASAVAGPRILNSGSVVCNVAPMMVCGDPAAGGSWGYTNNAPQVLKKGAGGQSEVGPGNFQLIQLGGPGAAIVRQSMAGSYSACLAGGTTIQTQPGVEAGPVAQGLNTRFGDYRGPMSNAQATYPPDVIVDAQEPALRAVERVARDPSQGYDIYQDTNRIDADNIADLLYDYDEYVVDLEDPENYDYDPINEGGTPGEGGAFGRRVLAVPVGDCTGTVGGSGSVPLLGFACFFLLAPAEQQGSNAFVYGQFVEDCAVTGTPGPNPVANNGPAIIQLYRDPASNDS